MSTRSSLPIGHGDLVHLLGTVASAANQSSDVEYVVCYALEQVAEFTGWPVGQAFRTDSTGAAAGWLSWHREDDRYRRFVQASSRIALPRGVGLPGRVTATGGPAWVADVAADPNFPRIAAAVAAGLHGAFAFPVTVADEVVAVCEFFSDRKVEPEAEFLDGIRQLGMHLGRVFERQDAHRASVIAAHRLREILDNAGDAFIGMDAGGYITEWNRQAEQIFGWPRDDVIGRAVSEVMVPEEYREAHDRGIARFLATGQARVLGERLELSALRRDGKQFPVEFTLWALREDESWSFYCFARDITTRKQVEADLAHDALHDGLTGLANRTALTTRLTHGLDRMARGETAPAVLFVDLDRFKPINDTFGHEAGDQVLITVARRLLTLIRPTDLVARLAGDEFVLLIDETATARDATVVAARIVAALGEPVELAEQRVTLSASVGVALARPDSTAESLLRDADAAMYQAKHAGRGRYDIYGEQLRNRVTSRLQRETELSRALTDGQLELYYQPVIALADRRISGVEALLRWQHPMHGQLLPAEFIDVAEESGQIVPIGSWVLAEACRQLSVWRNDPAVVTPSLQVAVNLSARQLAHADLPEHVAATVAAAALEFADVQLCLEITESVLMQDPQAAATTLTKLRDLGVTVAIDDFGTGYSSLSYLKWFPVDTVKIDRSFVATLTTNRTDRAIVKAVVELAGHLGMQAVAEGVETSEQLEILTELGCSHVQGFLFARPQPAAELTELLRTDHWLPSALASRTAVTG